MESLTNKEDKDGKPVEDEGAAQNKIGGIRTKESTSKANN